MVERIAEDAGEPAEKNAVIRYRPEDSTNMVFEQYDSLVAGIRFRNIAQEKAFALIDSYFTTVRSTKNYLYLTNLHFNKSFESYYDVTIAPVNDQLELIRFVGTWPVNYDHSNEDVVTWFRKKQQEFGFDIVVADVDRIEARITRGPANYTTLAEEIYAFCPDVIGQGHSDMAELVAFLESDQYMWFWWD